MAKKRIQITDVVLFLIMGLASVFSAFHSGYSPLNQIALGGDAAVYGYIGWGMTKGLVPYIHMWDNKGPFFYFLEYLGALIHPHFGVFVIEVIAIFSTCLLLYKVARLFTSKLNSCLAAISCILVLVYFYSGGNSCEEMAMPFITLSLYILTKAILNEYAVSWWQAAIVGACFSA